MTRPASHPSRRSVLAAGLGAVATLPFAPVSARAGSDALGFLVVGDWGRDGGMSQRAVAGAMAAAATAGKPRFILSVGDNFYEDGVASVDDPHFAASFERIYDAPALQAPWYVALGNHDYKGSVEAQIAYSARNPRWRMPARYHSAVEKLPGGGSVEIFVLDTCPFVGRYRGTNVRTNGQDPAAQLAWLEAGLAKSTARCKIVVGHHPVISGGRDHGSTPELLRDVRPLLERHGVTAYFFGHDHDLQHLAKSDVAYFGCGAGANARPTSMTEGSVFAADKPGFLSAEIGPDGLSFAFIDETGAVLHRGAVPLPT